MPVLKQAHILTFISNPINFPIRKSAFDMAANIGSDSDLDINEHVSHLSPNHQQL